MTKLLKMIRITIIGTIITCSFINNSYAQFKYVDCARALDGAWYNRIDEDDSEAMRSLKQKFISTVEEFNAWCKKLMDSGLKDEALFEFHSTFVNRVREYVKKDPNLQNEWVRLNNDYLRTKDALERQRKCEKNPFECMDETSREESKARMETAKKNYADITSQIDQCSGDHWSTRWASKIDEDDIKELKESGKCTQEQIANLEKAIKEHIQAEKELYGKTQSERLKESAWHTVENDAAVYDAKIDVGPVSITIPAAHKGDLAEAYKGSEGEVGLRSYEERSKSYRGDNSACDIAGMQNKYQSSCYSCKIILTLITTFMNACGRVYDLTRDAGGKVLIIGSLMWLAAFALKLVSSFTNQEPMSILNDFFIFMFKATAAYIMLNAGIGIIVNLFVNPLLIAGADYGIGLMQAANQGIVNITTTTNYNYTGTEIVSSKVINKLMALTQGIDKTVATNLVIGHALTCHSFNAGMITIDFGITIRIPDLWIWLCGAAIWFCGFMLTLGVGYYLLDVCFKIGFCIIALPIVIGLWPFSKTEGKFKSCMSIIIRSAALFAFLALTVSYALSLISASLGDVSVLFEKVKAGDHEWISNTFSITGSQFIIIMFAYIYSIKMVGATVTGCLSQFFSDSVFGNASPIHEKATQITDFAKQKVTQAAGFVGGVVTHQASRATAAVLGGSVNMVKRAVRGKKSDGTGSSGNLNSNRSS